MHDKIKRFGCHSFLNAQPLIYPLISGIIPFEFELVLDTPARLARYLKVGEIDAGIIPSIECAGEHPFSLCSGISISSFGTVGTVLLVCKVPVREMKTVAVDERSLTSVVMLEIILRKKYETSVEFIRCNPDVSRMLDMADGALIIGDHAFFVDRSRYKVLDLGCEWFDLTGNVFVHAVLAVREGIDPYPTLALLQRVKETGLSMVHEISIKESKKLGVDPAICEDYLTHMIRYDFGIDEQEGLQHFFALSREIGAINDFMELKVYD